MTETGEDYLAPACGLNCPVHVISDASSILSLPTIIRDPTSALQVLSHERHPSTPARKVLT